MKAASIRSGLVESTHDWSAVMSSKDRVIETWGDSVDEPLFARSTVKPFQATIAQQLGAALVPEQMAVACSSHSGAPAHIAIVGAMLADVGLDAPSLRCPPSLPLGRPARHRWIAAGKTDERIAHNCSGKHAAFLRACLAQDWDPSSYVAPTHPLQQLLVEAIGDATGDDPRPVGIDGCGAPTPRMTLAGLARAFARLSSDPEMDEARTAMQRYPALTADNVRPDGQLAMWWAGPVKVGAAGLIALGRDGWGLAVKSWEGSRDIAVVGAIEALRRCGFLEPHVAAALEPVAQPPVLGGGKRVGEIVPDVTHIETEARS